MPLRDRPRSRATDAVWAGEERPFMDRATQVPVVHSVSFGYHDLDTWRAVALGEAEGHIYGRNTNPTVAVFEEKVRVLERAEAATSFATGMAAISDTLLTLLVPGDRVVSLKDTYGGTNRLFDEFLPALGIDVELCTTHDRGAIEAAIDRGASVLYLESPTNPTCKVVDIAGLAERARAQGATVVVDNTFATPINQHPLELGADLVVHSATKFLGGHADALGGALAGNADLVARVHYPGLPSHPGHEVAARQMPGGFGGVLSFELDGDFALLQRFLPRLRLAHRAANLGAVETVVAPPATGSHVELTAEQRAALGIPETLVRYSCGIEDADDLIADLDAALDEALHGGATG